ncbi:MAG: hypothetical protein KBD31_03190 [Proteobacteria bacterium]|nr:hypothetical protein [Pseudomonadota bacterium]
MFYKTFLKKTKHVLMASLMALPLFASDNCSFTSDDRSDTASMHSDRSGLTARTERNAFAFINNPAMDFGITNEEDMHDYIKAKFFEYSTFPYSIAFVSKMKTLQFLKDEEVQDYLKNDGEEQDSVEQLYLSGDVTVIDFSENFKGLKILHLENMNSLNEFLRNANLPKNLECLDVSLQGIDFLGGNSGLLFLSTLAPTLKTLSLRLDDNARSVLQRIVEKKLPFRSLQNLVLCGCRFRDADLEPNGVLAKIVYDTAQFPALLNMDLRGNEFTDHTNYDEDSGNTRFYYGRRTKQKFTLYMGQNNLLERVDNPLIYPGKKGESSYFNKVLPIQNGELVLTDQFLTEGYDDKTSIFWHLGNLLSVLSSTPYETCSVSFEKGILTHEAVFFILNHLDLSKIKSFSLAVKEDTPPPQKLFDMICQLSGLEVFEYEGRILDENFLSLLNPLIIENTENKLVKIAFKNCSLSNNHIRNMNMFLGCVASNPQPIKRLDLSNNHFSYDDIKTIFSKSALAVNSLETNLLACDFSGMSDLTLDRERLEDLSSHVKQAIRRLNGDVLEGKRFLVKPALQGILQAYQKRYFADQPLVNLSLAENDLKGLIKLMVDLRVMSYLKSRLLNVYRLNPIDIFSESIERAKGDLATSLVFEIFPHLNEGEQQQVTKCFQTRAALKAQNVFDDGQAKAFLNTLPEKVQTHLLRRYFVTSAHVTIDTVLATVLVNLK